MESSYQGKGLGRFLVVALQLLASKFGMEWLLMTVFKSTSPVCPMCPSRTCSQHEGGELLHEVHEVRARRDGAGRARRRLPPRRALQEDYARASEVDMWTPGDSRGFIRFFAAEG